MRSMRLKLYALFAALLLLLTDRFPETSFPRLIPWVAALLLACFALTGQGATVEPLKEKVDDLRQSILDRLFFTDPRDVFSLSTEGYYPEGPDQLGGKPNPSDHPVMQVSTPRTAYLRGVVLDEYNGRSWRNTTGGRRYLWQSPRLSQERIALFNQDLPPESVSADFTEPLNVSVRMLSDSASTLFVPQRIRDLTTGGEMVPYFSNASELFITRNLQSGDTWRVSAPMPIAGDAGLGTFLDLCATMDDPGWEAARERYTSLPSHLEQPVYALAASVSAAGNTPYEKVMALRTYLSREFYDGMNYRNFGQTRELPMDTVVETFVTFDATGIHPAIANPLPKAAQLVVQATAVREEMFMEAAAEWDESKLTAALCQDPLVQDFTRVRAVAGDIMRYNAQFVRK